MGLPSPLLLFAATCCLGGASALTFLLWSSREDAFVSLLGGYAARLDRHLGFLLFPIRGMQVARAQFLTCAGMLALTVAAGSWIPAAVAAAIALGPRLWLWRRHRRRVAQLERQLDAWLLMLANALKATSSMGEAIASTASLVPKPFSEEVDLLVKEIRLGAPVDRALQAAARRINSGSISGAFATITVARQTGGDLPRTLERSAAALRESARLEGVLRTKTAEGRGQVLVLASVPFLLGAMIAWLNPTWFDPMLEQRVGRFVLGACGLVWSTATVWAYQISRTEL